MTISEFRVKSDDTEPVRRFEVFTGAGRRCEWPPEEKARIVAESCKLNGVEPFAYLTDVITRIVNGHPNRRIEDLLPWAYITEPELKAMA